MRLAFISTVNLHVTPADPGDIEGGQCIVGGGSRDGSCIVGGGYGGMEGGRWRVRGVEVEGGEVEGGGWMGDGWRK